MKKVKNIALYPVKLIYRWLRSISKLFLSILFFNDHRLATACDITRGIFYLSKKKVKFPHPIGIVIGMKVELGENCIIYQNVTLGTKDIFDFNVANAKYPKIGNNVTICANSIVFGDITIGNNVVIGAASMITQNVPDNCVIAGNPARIIKMLKKE